MVEGGPGDAHDLGDGSLGDFLPQEHPDFLLLAVKLGGSQRPFGAAEQAALGSGGGKPFLGPLGDQVPLNLGEQPNRAIITLLLSAPEPRFLASGLCWFS